MNTEFLKELKVLENKMDKNFVITSGTRCKKNNQANGGVYNSQHLKGFAVDISGSGWSDNDKNRLARYAKESGYFTKVVKYTDSRHIHIEYRPGDYFSYKTKTKGNRNHYHANSYERENYFYLSFGELSGSIGLNKNTDDNELGFNNGWFIHKPYVKIWDFYYSAGTEYNNFKSKNSYGLMYDGYFDGEEMHYAYLIYEKFFATSDNIHYDNSFSFELVDLGLGLNIELDEKQSYYFSMRFGYRYILDDLDIHYSYRALKGPYIRIAVGLGGAPDHFN
tara:strand:- start:757 stop:1590 length:834 start_codon:yes stop_codon:yes gene_type:complete